MSLISRAQRAYFYLFRAIKAHISTCFLNLANRFLCFINTRKILLLILSVVGILVDVFIFPFTSDVVIFGLTLIWVGAVVGWRLEGRFSIAGALVFLSMCPLLLILERETIAEKAAIWAYMFLLVGVGHQIIECLRKQK